MPFHGSLLRLYLAACLLAAPAMAQQRVVLNGAVRTQISALQAEKAARSPAQRKMDSRLVHRVKKQRGERIGAGLEQFEAKVKPSVDGRELVDIKATVNDALLASLRAGGAEIVSSVPRFNAVRAKVPLAQLEPLAARAEVQFVKPAARAFTNAGAFSSQGDGTHAANTARTTFKATGRGVKVGVLSDSVDFLSMAQSTGDLGAVTVLPGQDGLGESGEGTAMLEIVHDVAPDAELFFASAFLSEAQFAQNILDLRKAGCDIIVDDVIYLDESPFMDGPVAQAADAVVADGALFFSAAGNEGNKNDNTSGTWEGDFVDGGEVGAPIGGSGRLHAFGVNNFNTVLSAGEVAVFFWADPYGASSNDYDLYLLNSTGTAVLDSSTNAQDGTQDPLEFIDSPPFGARFVIVKALEAQPRFLHLKNFRGRLSASTSGACVGHAAAANAIAVAAVNAATSNPNPFTGGVTNPVRTYSADGPRRIFYYADGTAITPGNFSATGGTVRQKPEIAAADGVATATPGFNPFDGTSAAAPHAAAIAALVWSYNRALSPAQVRAALTSTALNIEAAGVDRDSGSGIVMAPAAIGAVAPGAIVSFVSANVTAESFVPANVSLDPGETMTVSLTLRNIGAAPGTITATLLNTGGVSTASAPQSYGTLAASGGQAARDFTFTANGPAGGTLNANFAIDSGGVSLGTITVPFTFGAVASPVQVTNSNAITINDNAAASPYPSQINISGVTGNVSKVTVTMRQLTHTQPGDLSLLLVSPSGRKVEFYQGAGFGNPITNPLTFTVDDTAGSALPMGTLTSGTFRPAKYDAGRDAYTTPAPTAPYASTLNTFNGDAPNGTWSLYVIDSYAGDIGAFNAGWTLNITPSSIATNGAGPDLSVLVAPVAPLSVGDAATFSVQVFNNGPAAANSVTLNSTLPAALAPISRVVSQGSGTINGQDVSANFGTIAPGASATLTLNANAVASDLSSVSFAAGLSGADNNTLNNTASTNVAIGRSNLAPSQVVLSTEAGTSSDAATFQSGQSLFVDFTLGNSGDGPASQLFNTQVFLDGVLQRTIPRAFPLSPGGSLRPVDLLLGPLTAGEHTLLVRTDTGAAVAETNEGDNEIVRTFTVEGPNLAPGIIVVSKTAGTTTDTPIFQTTDSVFVDYSLVNDGEFVTGVATTADVFLDGNLVTQFNIPDTLAPAQSAGAIDLALGSLAPGTHTIRVVLDSGSLLAETNEADNEFTKDFSVNAPPTIGNIADTGTLEDESLGPILFNVGDAETPVANLMVSAVSTNPDLSLSVSGTGSAREITITPAANANGFGTITVTVDDGTGGTASRSFVVTVTAVNDPPSFTGGAGVTVNEDGGLVTIASWATALSVGPANESGQTLSFLVGNDKPALFTVPPAINAAGTLTFTPAPNANGQASVTVLAQDSEGASTSSPVTFTITINAANDAPSFTLGGNRTVARDAGAQSFANFVTNISPGPADESSQTISFFAVALNPVMFAVQPTIAANGTLAFTPAANASGTTTVTMAATDSAGAISAPGTFQITITSFAEEAGSYNGLIGPLAAAGSSAAQSGAISVKFSSTGAATGKLQLGGVSYSFKGAVLNDGKVRFGTKVPTATLVLPRRGQASLSLLLLLDVTGSSGQLTGTVMDGTTTFATVRANRAGYDARTAPALPPLAGRYTVLLPHHTGVNNAVPSWEYPQGDGFGTLTIKPNGVASLSGTLADGSKISVASPLSADNRWPLFATTDGKRGAVAGFVDFGVAGESYEAIATGLLWHKPANPNAPRYRSGWPGGIFVDVAGGGFEAIDGLSLLPGLGVFDEDGNVEFRGEDGGLAAPLLKALSVDVKDRVRVLFPVGDGFRISINRRTGLVSGRFLPRVGEKPVSFSGAILQSQLRAGGFFLGRKETGSITVRPDDTPGIL